MFQSTCRIFHLGVKLKIKLKMTEERKYEIDAWVTVFPIKVCVYFHSVTIFEIIKECHLILKKGSVVPGVMCTYVDLADHPKCLQCRDTVSR